MLRFSQYLEKKVNSKQCNSSLVLSFLFYTFFNYCFSVEDNDDKVVVILKSVFFRKLPDKALLVGGGGGGRVQLSLIPVNLGSFIPYP